MSDDEWNDHADPMPSRIQPKSQPKTNGINRFSNCGNCGKPGHLARFCPAPKVNRNGHRKPIDQADIWGPGAGVGPKNGMINTNFNMKHNCWKCGSESHFARECPDNSKGNFNPNAQCKIFSIFLRF